MDPKGIGMRSAVAYGYRRSSRSRACRAGVAAAIMALGLTLGANTALASTCTWTGALNSTFNSSTNWTGGGCTVPGPGDTAQFNATSSVACNITSSVTVGTVSISGYTG